MGDVIRLDGNQVRIGFSFEKGFQPVSWLVKRATNAPCSHCFFRLWDETLQMEMVLQAAPNGFVPTPWDRFERENDIVALWTPHHPIIRGVRKVAELYLDTPYYFGGLFGMAWVEIGEFFKRQWRNPFHSKAMVFCSDASALALRWSSSAYGALRPDSTSPGYLLRWAQEHEPDAVQV